MSASRIILLVMATLVVLCMSSESKTESESVVVVSKFFKVTESCLNREPAVSLDSSKLHLVHAERYAPVRILATNGSTNTFNDMLVSFEFTDDQDDEDVTTTTMTNGGFAVIVQAVEIATGRLIGSWTSDETLENYSFDKCSHTKDTLISKDLDAELATRRFRWTIDEKETFGDFNFVATIIRADGTYWSDVHSEVVRVSNSISEVQKQVAEASSQVDEIKSRARRNIFRHFQDSTAQCGARKSCYVSLNTCDVNPSTCNFVLSWEFDGELVNFELTGLSYAWISVAFSQDPYWGDDNLVICARDPDNNQLSINHFYKPVEDSQLIKLEPHDHLTSKFITYNQADGFIYCRFSRPRTIENNRYVTDLSQPHFIYIERGAPGEIVGEKLNRGFQPSDSRIEFANRIHAPVSHRSWLVKVHAILGIIAWIFLAALGIILARYYKPLWPNHVLYHYRVWFSFHRSIMIFVLLLTLVSFLFALIELDWMWSQSSHALLHSILGVIVIICACINPLLGFFRPSPNTPMRCLFFWLHWLVGTVAFCLAVPAIFIGMDLPKSDLPNWCSWLLFVWVIVHIVIEIILEIHYCCTFSQLQGNLHEKNLDYDRINKIPIKNTNPPGYRWKPTLLFLYAIFTGIVVSALTIALLLLE